MPEANARLFKYVTLSRNEELASKNFSEFSDAKVV